MPSLTPAPNPIARRMRIFARAGAASTSLLALGVLAGHVSGSANLANLGSNGPAMSVVTALALIFLAAHVTLRSFDRAGRGFAAAAACLALTALASSVVVGSDEVSGFIARSVFGSPVARFGRTSLSSAVCIVALASSSLPHRERQLRWLPGLRLTDLSCGFALVLSGLGLLGYLYHARLLLDVAPFSEMSLATAAALFVLSLATLAARPTHGWAATFASTRAGGAATRRQLLFTLLPPIVGWYLLDSIDSGIYAPNAAMALLVALTIVPLALLVLRDGAVLDLLDLERSRHVERTAQMNVALGEQLAAQARQLRTQAQERLDAETALNRTQRLEAVGQLTGGIAHDFNNLLMAVQGNLDLMRRHLPEDHDVLRHVERAAVAAAKGARITQQLLSFSRTQKLEIRAVDVGLVLESALELITRALGPNTSVALQIEHDRWAAADPDQFELALLNLAINSRDALRDGGHIRIGQALRAGTSNARKKPSEFVVVTVADNGIGMSAAVLARATEPFFTTKAHGKGTGLGLAQAYGFAKQCGGDLRISSVEGEGTTIELWLPRRDPVQPLGASIGHGVASTSQARRSRHLLVIDDDDAVRSPMVEALRDGGQHVIEANDGPSGLDRLAEARPDVAVIDFLMPGMNGADVARAAQRLHPGLPIVFVSGYMDTLALDGIPHSIVLRKPFELQSLAEAIERVLVS